jgi:hypothetical protein
VSQNRTALHRKIAAVAEHAAALASGHLHHAKLLSAIRGIGFKTADAIAMKLGVEKGVAALGTVTSGSLTPCTPTQAECLLTIGIV